MKGVWPETAGCLCARMNRGLNGQDANGLLVVITLHGRESVNFQRGGVASTLMARQYKQADDLIVEEPVIYPGVGITSKENASNPQPGDPAPSVTTDSRNYLVQRERPKRKYIVRRLTPTECARLQGFPDWWCDGANGSDSAQYKLWGNGIALPCAADVLGRIAKEILSNKEGRA